MNPRTMTCTSEMWSFTEVNQPVSIEKIDDYLWFDSSSEEF
jgi:hypothetical protein